jgi:Putative glycosyl/glycerophosphate transferases involved in teichoic acid biosynthesis TagF/TagB/EpsJ/RodC
VEKEKTIFVMPTWRANLVGSWDGRGQSRAMNPQFHESGYARTWRHFFANPKLRELLERTGYGITFFAHPCVEPYLEGLDFPAFVQKRSKSQGSIIRLMQCASLMITDFSSVAFDMAYMHSPVIYYQYESKAEFTRQQAWKSGYIDYESMGFGPVCANEEGLLLALEQYLNTGCVMEERYLARVRETFPYRDANCCARAVAYIREMERA